jgi:hypothetical protein
MSETGSTQDANAVVDAMFGIFGQSIEEMSGIRKDEDDGGDGLQMFKPDPNKSDDKMWRGLIKFLPNIEDAKNPIIRKTTYWLEDPRGAAGHGSFRFDSPKSLGKHERCPVAAKYWEWKDSDDARLRKQAAKLSYSRKAFALIQVLVDFQNPDNNGNIYAFNLPVKIQNMIEAKMYPSQQDIEAGEIAENVFNPLNSPVMMLKIGLKTVKDSEFRDWDGCTWHKTNLGMMVDGKVLVKDKNVKVGKNEVMVIPTDPKELQELQMKIVNTLKEAQSLKEFKYTAPSAETLRKVNEILAVMAGQPINDESDAPVDQKPDKKDADAEMPTDANKEAASQDTEYDDTDDLVNELLS